MRGQLDSLINQVRRARETLDQLQEMVTEIGVSKEIFATAKTRVVPGNHRS